jgi:hypothetical protein
MGNLKGNIQHEVHLFELKSLEKDFSMEMKVEKKNTTTIRVETNNYRDNNVPSSNPTALTNLTPQKIDERIKNGLCFNCDKYNKGNKRGEKKIF